jgi:CheY-like chemotaxis protein
MLKEIEAGEVDLVLLDVSLTSAQWQGQIVNGVELCQILKKKSPRRLPVLLATAHTMSGDRERFLEASGADGCLEKPVYDSAALVEKSSQLMD